MRKIVLADGCFDPLHVGHLEYLQAARRLGGVLIVRVADNLAVLAKGRTPFQSRLERLQLVGALRIVDEVYPTNRTLVETILALRPHVLAKGSDWAGKLPADVIDA